jgi:protein BCP1
MAEKDAPPPRPPLRHGADNEAEEDESILSSESSGSSDEDARIDLQGNKKVEEEESVSSSGSDDSSEEEEKDAISDRGEVKPAPSSRTEGRSSSPKRKAGGDSSLNKKRKKRQKKKQRDDDDDALMRVEFTFCEMNEKFFHGLKSLLHSSSTLYRGATTSSELTDLMISNVEVGTVVSSEAADEESTCFGFASVLNAQKYRDSSSVKHLHDFLIQSCPAEQHKSALEKALSSKKTGFLLHGRMVNLPLEIVQELHQQLHLDLEWALENADKDEKPFLQYEFLIRLAPCWLSNGQTEYRYFDDETFADRANFAFTTAAPVSYSKEEQESVCIMLLTTEGYQQAIKDLSKLIKGT